MKAMNSRIVILEGKETSDVLAYPKHDNTKLLLVNEDVMSAYQPSCPPDLYIVPWNVVDQYCNFQGRS